MSKQFAVLGLGSFGWSVALTLEKMGADVLVVDDSFEKIQEISEQVSYALKADVSDPEALEALAKYLGHSSVSQTKQYIGITDDRIMNIAAIVDW